MVGKEEMVSALGSLGIKGNGSCEAVTGHKVVNILKITSGLWYCKCSAHCECLIATYIEFIGLN